MTKNKFCGVDYSMTSPGVTIHDGENFTSYFISTNKKFVGNFHSFNGHRFIGLEYPDWTTPEQRFDAVSELFFKIIPTDVKMIVIEGYAFGSTSSSLFQIAENCGVFKQKLYKAGLQFVTAAPSEIKKFATGKGNAKKEQMHEAFVTETGIDLQDAFMKKLGAAIGSPVGDIVDSYYMCKFSMKNHQ